MSDPQVMPLPWSDTTSKNITYFEIHIWTWITLKCFKWLIVYHGIYHNYGDDKAFLLSFQAGGRKYGPICLLLWGDLHSRKATNYSLVKSLSEKKGKEWSYFYKEAKFWLSGFVTSQKTFKIPNLPPSCLASRASKSPPAKWVPSFESDAHFEVCIEQRKKPLFQWNIWLKPTLIAQSSPGPTQGILGLITACLFISLAPPARRSQLKRALKTYTTY